MTSHALPSDPAAVLRSSLRAELVAAARSLDRRRRDVHGARKHIKRARALARLLRDVIGEAAYRRLNMDLRNVGRSLARMRDAEIVLLTLRAVAKEDPALRAGLAQWRRALQLQRDARRRAIDGRVSLIRRRIERIGTRPISDQCSGWEPIARALRRTYKRGRHALETARDEPTAEHLHEWRKRVQHYRHQREALGALAPQRKRTLARKLHELSELLGADHDLFVLSERAARSGRHLDSRTQAALQKAIARQRRKLQREAFALGARLYAEKPHKVVRPLSRLHRQV